MRHSQRPPSTEAEGEGGIEKKSMWYMFWVCSPTSQQKFSGEISRNLPTDLLALIRWVSHLRIRLVGVSCTCLGLVLSGSMFLLLGNAPFRPNHASTGHSHPLQQRQALMALAELMPFAEKDIRATDLILEEIWRYPYFKHETNTKAIYVVGKPFRQYHYDEGIMHK